MLILINLKRKKQVKWIYLQNRSYFDPVNFPRHRHSPPQKCPPIKKQYTNQSHSTHWLQWRRREILWNQRTRFVLFTSLRAQNTELSPAIQLTRERSVTDCGRTETKSSPNSRHSGHCVRGKGWPRG